MSFHRTVGNVKAAPLERCTDTVGRPGTRPLRDINAIYADLRMTSVVRLWKRLRSNLSLRGGQLAADLE